MPIGDYDNNEILRKINGCIDRRSRLNSFERKVMSTCLDMADKNIMLSEAQLKILNETWERVAGFDKDT